MGVYMEKFLEYAPVIIVAVIFFIQYRIFVTPAQLNSLKSDLIEYIADHYVSGKTYRDNHLSLENRIDRIDKNVNDVKTLLISIVHWNGNPNN